MLVHILQALSHRGSKSAHYFLRKPKTISVYDDKLQLYYDDGGSKTLTSADILTELKKLKSSKVAGHLLWELSRRYDGLTGNADETEEIMRTIVQKLTGIRPEPTPFLLTEEGFESRSHPNCIKGNITDEKLAALRKSSRITIELREERGAVDTKYLYVLLPFSSVRKPLQRRLQEIAA